MHYISLHIFLIVLFVLIRWTCHTHSHISEEQFWISMKTIEQNINHVEQKHGAMLERLRRKVSNRILATIRARILLRTFLRLQGNGPF